MFTIRPYLFTEPIFALCIANKREVIKTGRRLVLITLSKFSTEVSVIGSKPPIPTLLTIISMSPQSLSNWRRINSKSRSSHTSTRENSAPVAFATSSPRLASISQNATRSPASVNASTIARPMPCAAPVTNTRRGAHSFRGCILLASGAKTSIKLFGNTIFSTPTASKNNGATSSAFNPAIPQPMGVTRNNKSALFFANAIKSSTYGLMAPAPPCIVGIA